MTKFKHFFQFLNSESFDLLRLYFIMQKESVNRGSSAFIVVIVIGFGAVVVIGFGVSVTRMPTILKNQVQICFYKIIINGKTINQNYYL